MHPGRFFGFACNVRNPITSKVLQCNTNPYKRNILVHIGAVVPRNLSEMGYNSDLDPNSDAYFPEVHLKSMPHIKPDTPVHQGTVDTRDIFISEEGEKSDNPLSSPSVAGINHSEVYRPAAESKDAAEDVPGTADEFPDLQNWYNVNKNGTTDEIFWGKMGLEEVQDQLNDADKSDISAINILLRYWKSGS